MIDRFSWTANFCRWWGVALKFHLFFFLFAAVIFCVDWHYVQDGGVGEYTALVTVLAVLLSAIGHELAHAFAATTLGGRLRELVVTPWGGPSDILMPPAPREQLIVHAAGPFFNFTVFAIGALLLTTTGQADLERLINPLHPFPLGPGNEEISLTCIVTWVNFQMLVVNLIPAFPFDASRVIQSGVQTYNPRTPTLNLENAILGIGIACGLLMFLFAWLLRENNYGAIQPTWFVLVTAGILLIFSSRYGYHLKVMEAQQELHLLDDYLNYEMLDDDFETSESWISEFEEDAIADWLHDQQPRNESAERSVAIDEETRVDAILKKLHDQGKDALTEEEKEFLNRISQQYRRRRELRS